MPSSKSTAKTKLAKTTPAKTTPARTKLEKATLAKTNTSVGKIHPVHHESSGNVFKDMGKTDADANNLFLRSTLMIAIEEIIDEHGWTQVEAARKIGVARPRIAELRGSRIDLFSLDTLVKYLYRLGKQITLVIKDKEVA